MRRAAVCAVALLLAGSPASAITPRRAAALSVYRGPADAVPAAQLQGAWGDRLLVSRYKGPLWQVVRASDGAVRTLGAASDGGLSASELQAFCGTSTVYVSRKYDQSGNGNDLVQATTSLQPIACTAGALYLVAGHAVSFYNNAQYLSSVATVTLGLSATFVAVFEPTATPPSNGGILFSESPAGSGGGIVASNGNLSFNWGSYYTYNGAYNIPLVLNRPLSYSLVIASASLAELRGSGTLFASSTSTLTAPAARPMQMGTDAYAPSTRAVTGYIPEGIVTTGNSELVRAQIEDNQRAYWRTP